MWQNIKLILKSVRQYKKYAIITPIFMIGEALLECALPFVISIFVDAIKPAYEVASLEGLNFGQTMVRNVTYTNATMGWNFQVSLLGCIITLIVMAMLSMVFGILGGMTAAKASVGMATNLRSDLYKKIQSFSFSNIDRFHASSLVTRMTTDVNNVQMAYQIVIRGIIRAPLMVVFSTVMAFIAGGNMAWIFLALIPVIAIGLFFIAKFAMGIFMRVFKRYDKLNESVQENVSGIRVVKSYVREEYEKDKFNRASDDMANEFIHAEKIIALNNPLMNTTIHLSNILVLIFGSWIIYENFKNGVNGLTPGQLSSLLTYGIQILSSLMFVSMMLVMLLISVEAIRRVAEVLKEEPSIVNPENPIMEVPNGEVVFNNVNFKYVESAEKNTLENINLKIKSGQFIGILGGTGSGKTSLVNLISRLYDINEGEILVGGHSVKEYDLKTLRDNVAVVLQKNVLFSGTIASNLRWGNKDATEEEMWKACEITQAAQLVREKEGSINSRVEQGGANFSGGQKQRLCIARAILKNPKILILDDSTSAVDTKTDRLIRKALKEDLPNMTKIVIAQRISSIEDADQIIIMDDGKISEIGTHETLLAHNKIYQEVYYTQNKVGGEQ
ncbi:MAG: ABC transporter ATP-binding protein/permease [Bacilli bacterium]|nr:ABC transporter ATP-binding protein/permease [Bacilli bacterium]